MKTLILIRHAHRDYSDRTHDNGLSKKGREQAKLLQQFFKKRMQQDFKGIKPVLLSSPKLRCLETLVPIAKSTKIKVEEDARLIEALSHEDSRAFQDRVRIFLDDWMRSGAALTIACSHGDWIPMAFSVLFEMQVDVRKASWTELTYARHRPELSWLVQSLSSLGKK